MDTVKKNIVSIILGVVAIAAAVAAFYPLGGKAEALKEKVAQSKSQHDAVKSLLDKSRNKPSLRIGGSAEALGQFPSEAAIKRAQEATARLAAESQEMYQTAVTMNRKTILVENALPKPRSTEDWDFRKTYQAYFNSTEGGFRQWLAALRATEGATPEAVKQETSREEAVIRRDEQRIGEEVYNAAEIEARIARRTAEIPDELRTRLAQEHALYINKDTFVKNDGIIGSNPGPMEAEEMWWAQVGIWLQEEIVAAVAHTNRDATNVADAPIKHLLKITFPTEFTLNGAGNSGGATSALPKAYAVSHTGRASNGMYDVMQFDMDLVVAVERIPYIVKALSDSRFLSVLEMDVESADSAAVMAAGYVYGPEPVAKLNMRCEALFLREWTTPFMPNPVKVQLGLAEAPAAAAPARR
jgi:hypothetical protein